MVSSITDKNKKPKTITILGIKLDEENFPELYQWAKENPATLEVKLKDVIKMWHDYPAERAVGALEESLEADHNHRHIFLPNPRIY